MDGVGGAVVEVDVELRTELGEDQGLRLTHETLGDRAEHRARGERRFVGRRTRSRQRRLRIVADVGWRPKQGRHGRPSDGARLPLAVDDAHGGGGTLLLVVDSRGRHGDLVAVVDGLDETRRHRAVLSPLRAQHIDHGPTHVRVDRHAGHQTAPETVLPGDAVGMNLVLRVHGVVEGADDDRRCHCRSRRE